MTSTTDADDTPPSHALRRFLKLETERLRMRQRLGLGGSEVAAVRSDTVDHVLRRVCSEAAQAAGRETQRELTACAVVALGGYGRRELSPVLGRRPAVPALGLAGAVARGLRRARADDALGRGAQRRPQLPLGERVRFRGARRPALAHRAVRGAPRGGQRRPLPGARAAARDGAARQPLGARSLPHPDAARVDRADAAARGSRLRAGAPGQGGPGGPPRPAHRAVGGPRPLRHPRLRRARGLRPARRARREGAARRLRLPAARAQRGALRDRAPGRPADAGPARRGRDAARLPGRARACWPPSC